MTKRWAVALILVLATGCSEPPRPSTAGGGTSTAPGQKSGNYQAPDFTVETFDGARFRLATNQGTPVVLNFWESW